MKSPVAGLLCAALAGCATFSADGGFDRVTELARSRVQQAPRWPRTADERARRDALVSGLLAQPLTPDGAVQIALVNNHALQAAFAGLGVSEADLVQSGRVPNPRFTLRRASGGGSVDLEAALTVNVLSLLTMPQAHAAERLRFARAQEAVALEIVQLAERTRMAYFTALAARDSLHYARQVAEAARTSAELARRMRAAGNWNRLDEARQLGFQAEAEQRLARAALAEQTAGLELDRLLGLEPPAAALRLAEHLPELPATLADPRELEQAAMDSRLDLTMEREGLDELARRLKLAKATRLVNVLDLGPARVRQGPDGAADETGFEVSLEVPVFDSGAARVRKAEARYAEALERFAQAALDARAEVGTAAARVRTAFELALRQRDDIVPAAQAIAGEDRLRFNASLVSVFDLLADARTEITSVDDYIGSVRDFWIAQCRLDSALLGPEPW